MTNNENCKICNSSQLKIIYHVAICKNCNVLLSYPYPESDEEIFYQKKYSKDNIATSSVKDETQRKQEEYYLNSGELNLKNFNQMIKYAVKKKRKSDKINVLDFGGGGGQFASIFKNLYPHSKVYITDMFEDKLLDIYKNLNIQIKYENFTEDQEKFDFIFLNDVFEHLSDPIANLVLLKKKLKDENSKIFIDTPKSFWLYSFVSLINSKIYKKLLEGTVDQDHQQIWSKKSFYIAVTKAGLKVENYNQITEFTQPPQYYLKNMKIKNIFIKIVGHIFYFFAPICAQNKIISTLKKS